MNKTVELNIGQQLEAEALRVLRAIPDLTVTTEPGGRLGGRIDAIIRHADQETEVAVEVKRRVDVATAHHVIHLARETLDRPLLLIASETTAGARRVLADNDIAYIDGLGNARLELPGLILRLAGSHKPSPTRIRSTLSGKSGLVAQTLLLEPQREWHVKDVVEMVDVSVGLVHRVMTRLEEVGVLETAGTGPKRIRTVVNPSALLDLWDEEQVDQPTRTLAYRLSHTSRDLIEAIEDWLETAGIAHAFTGAAGASVVAPLATSVPVVEVWVDAAIPESALIDPPAINRVSEGHNIVFLQERDNAPLEFRVDSDGVCVANLFRIYHDLRQDPRRGPTQAEHLRERLIGF